MSLGVSNQVRIRLKNLGTNLINNALLIASIGESNFSSFITDPIAPNGTLDIYLGDYTPTTTGLIPGIAYVKTSEDVEASNDTVKVQWLVVSVEEFESQGQSLVLYPNPAESEIWVRTGFELSNGMEIYIEDVLGRRWQVDYQQFGSNEIRLDLPGIPSGLYNFILKQDTILKKVRFVRK
jgi:hypothetical protein